MSKLKVILVDDEQDSITTLKWELEVFKDKVVIIDSFLNPTEAVAGIKKHHPDILFLDIQMPIMNGFELLQEVQGYFEHVIFVTAFDDFAIQAFDVSAIDYILKPIESEKLKKSIEKVNSSHSQDAVKEQLELLLNNLNKNNQIDKIALPTMDGLIFVKPSEIIYCESDSNYTTVVMNDTKKILVSKTLKEIENGLLSKNFYRVHHSYVINLNYLEKYYKGNNAYVILEGKIQIPVSRNRKREFLDNL